MLFPRLSESAHHDANIAQPRSKLANNFPSVRTSSNLMRRFFILFERHIHRAGFPDLSYQRE
jgi:hypothetical protein